MTVIIYIYISSSYFPMTSSIILRLGRKEIQLVSICDRYEYMYIDNNIDKMGAGRKWSCLPMREVGIWYLGAELSLIHVDDDDS
jgi:hypothetical protein